MTVSVIIPAFNAESHIRDQLDALAAQAYDGVWEIVVADNRSSDRTGEIVEAYGSNASVPVRLVGANHRQGANAARNAGAAAAAGSLFLFVDADDRVQPGWLCAMTHGLQHFDCIGGSIELDDGSSVRTKSGLHDGGLGFLRSPVGANCGCRREVWNRLRFDEAFSGGGDETEFFWRAQLEGFTLGYLPDASVLYRPRSGTDAKLEQRESYSRGHVRLYKKFRRHGMPRSSTATALKDWAWILLTRLRRRQVGDAATEWRMRLARRRGRLMACLQLRTLYL